MKIHGTRLANFQYSVTRCTDANETAGFKWGETRKGRGGKERRNGVNCVSVPDVKQLIGFETLRRRRLRKVNSSGIVVAFRVEYLLPSTRGNPISFEAIKNARQIGIKECMYSVASRSSFV